MFKLDLEKPEEPEIKLPTSIGSSKSMIVQEKHLLLLYWLCQSLWLCGSTVVWITTNCGKFLRGWEYHTTWSASWEICMQVKKQQLELDVEQQTGSELGKEYFKAVYCHLAYLTYMQSSVQFSSVAQLCPTLRNPMNCSTPSLRVHHAKCQAGWSTCWNQDCREKYQSS